MYRHRSSRLVHILFRGLLICLVYQTGIMCACAFSPMKPMAGQGIMVGELTDHSAVIQVRLTRGARLVDGDLPGTSGVVKFTITPGRSGKKGQTINLEAAAQPEHDFIARVVVRELQSGQRYSCKTTIHKDGKSFCGPTAEFKTLPGVKNESRVNFVVVTGMNYAKFHGDSRIDKKQHLIENNTELPKPYQGPDKELGYPALKTILSHHPDFFIGTGDNVYYDTPDKPRAKTVTELRRKWHEQFVQPRYRGLFARTPTYWMVDDHDYRIDDCDNTGDYQPSPQTARQLMLEQLPYGPMGETKVKTYRTHRISKDLQLWFVENRVYRSPNKMKDGPDKTIWGEDQKRWLKKTLLQSDAKFKLLISPTPMVGPDDLRKTDNHTNFGGFRHERDEFFAWLNETGLAKKNFYLVCGDRHWQYHARHPTGIEEFSCGALVDANSRLGRKPGDPKSTDPHGLIKQIYTQKKRSGGFLEIRLTPAAEQAATTLAFVFFDETGKELYRCQK